MTIDPLAEYQKRNAERLERWSQCVSRTRVVSYLRLSSALIFLGMLWLAFDVRVLSSTWSLLPVGAFIVLSFYHERLRRTIARSRRAVTFYERGIERLENRWQGKGNPGTSYGTDSHLYAKDLDILGSGSLYELLCTAGTISGERTLARWLLEPASRADILSRQESVHELRNSIDLREDLSLLGTVVRDDVHPDFMIQWATAPLRLTALAARILALVLVGLTLAALLSSLLLGTSLMWAAYAAFIEIAFSLACRAGVQQVLTTINEPARELGVLGLALRRLDREQFTSPRLRQLQTNLSQGQRRPSQEIASLLKLVESLNQRRNEFFFLFSLPLLWATQHCFAIEAWRRRCGPSVAKWLENFGEFEALCSLAAYAYEHPADPFPEVVETGTVLEAADLRHPLLARESCVPNSVRLGGELRLLLVSGSNMSGKSTLLRTVGINAVLAQAGGPIRATRMKLCVLNIGATLRVQDSLQAGVSRFYAEIQRLHDTMELTSGTLPVLFLLDEILHGTNSHDRAIGAEAVIRGLVERGAIGLVTTHDLALARVADSLAPRAANVHFEDHLENGRMSFDYVLRTGVIEKSNALELMRSVGLSV